jgi:hypothetical protein
MIVKNNKYQKEWHNATKPFVIKTGPHLYLILLNVVFDGQETDIEDVKGENQIFYKSVVS